MMLYDEPNTAPEPQNGTGVVTEKGFFHFERSSFDNIKIIYIYYFYNI